MGVQEILILDLTSFDDSGLGFAFPRVDLDSLSANAFQKLCFASCPPTPHTHGPFPVYLPAYKISRDFTTLSVQGENGRRSIFCNFFLLTRG